MQQGMRSLQNVAPQDFIAPSKGINPLFCDDHDDDDDGNVGDDDDDENEECWGGRVRTVLMRWPL